MSVRKRIRLCFPFPLLLKDTCIFKLTGDLETCSASSKNSECLSTFILHGHREVSLGNGAAKLAIQLVCEQVTCEMCRAERMSLIMG